jgi:hypothetical protein
VARCAFIAESEGECKEKVKQATHGKPGLRQAGAFHGKPGQVGRSQVTGKPKATANLTIDPRQAGTG